MGLVIFINICQTFHFEMITQFLVSNIDAIITTTLGLFFTIVTRLSSSSSPNKISRVLRVLAPLVFAYGLLQFFIPSHSNDPPETWRTVRTDDGIAQVEFPILPTRTEATDRAGEIEVYRVTHSADLANGKLNLRFSFNEYPPTPEEVPYEVRMSGIKEYFVQQGFIIIEDLELPSGIWKLVVAKPDNKARMSFRIGLTTNGIYRALATSMAGQHDDARIDRFLESFTLRQPQSE